MLKLYESLKNTWLWADSEQLKWWLDLCMEYSEHGLIHTSESTLALRWDVTRSQVRTFLQKLQKSGWAEIIRCTTEGTTIQPLSNKGSWIVDTAVSNKGIARENDTQMEIQKLRERYSEKQREIIDRFFEVLKYTRVSGKLAPGLILRIYRDCDKYPVDKVIYAFHLYVNNVSHHDKKENYVMGIIRNARAEEIAKYKEEFIQGRKTQSQGLVQRSKFNNFEFHERDWDSIEKMESEALQNGLKGAASC